MNPTPERYLSLIKSLTLRRGVLFGVILLVALFAFEIFNYTTTDYALTDMLGASLKFIGIRWATILSIAFCGIDFAGIARLFTPEQGQDEPTEVWYLFGAWLLAAAMNAVLTWWGVAVAVRNHQELSTQIMGQTTLLKVVPIFVAIMVWLIRVLIIGAFSMKGERIFSLGEKPPIYQGRAIHPQAAEQNVSPRVRTPTMPWARQPDSIPFRPAPKPEQTYEPAGLAAASHNPDTSIRQ